MSEPLTPQLVLAAYCSGAFPMARHRGGPIDWYCPDPRAVMPLESFHVRRSLQKRVRSGRFAITFDRVFAQVVHACAQPRPGHPQTWISPAIERVYVELAQLGYGHSVEAWMTDDPGNPAPRLVGGLYGVSIGAAFFGESMFSLVPQASQVCLVHLVTHLRARGYRLLDVQFTNPHLEQFGVREIPRQDYLAELGRAINLPVTWNDAPSAEEA
jgi:leucyl/phenylalanyl-tRNA---protein transferase